MKKIVLILGMIFCLSVLTACGNEDASPKVLTEKEQAYADSADMVLSQIGQFAQQYSVEELAELGGEDLIPLVTNYNSGMEELGEITDITDHDVTIENKEVICNITVVGATLDPKGNTRMANVELVMEKSTGMPTSLSVNVNYTFGELMKKAGLNTLLGMGTVFAILILISFIISCFKFINMAQENKTKKQSKAAEKEAAVDNTIAQIIENEELSDDSELVAVISAAIAAYEAENGYVSADGVVIRSIRKVNKAKWQNA